MYTASFFLIFIQLILFVRADVPMPTGRFYKLDDLPASVRPPNLDQIANAIVKLDGSCAGVMISNDGYLLTARHCIEWRIDKRHFRIDDIDGIITTRITKSSAIGSFINLSISGENFSGTVVALGTGSVMEEKESYLQNALDVRTKLKEKYGNDFEFNSDFAIIKINSDHNFPCIKGSKKDKTPSFVLAIGFPNKTFRPGEFNSDGKSKFFSAGQFCDNQQIQDIKAKKNLSDLVDVLRTINEKYGTEKTIEAIETLGFSDRLKSHSATITGGNSGGGLLDDDGNLLGINVMGATYYKDKNSKNVHTDGNGYMLPLSDIIAFIKKTSTKVHTDTIFSCK